VLKRLNPNISCRRLLEVDRKQLTFLIIIVLGFYTFITDEPQKQRIIQQFKNKRGIVNSESAKD
jgi:hypothetical protein